MMIMLMMLMMMKLEQVPTFCTAKAWTLKQTSNRAARPHFPHTVKYVGPHFPHTADQWMDHSQSAVSRTSLSTACRMLQESVSRTMLSTECLNAEPFTWGPQCLPCVESSNVLLDEVLTKGSGHPWTE